MMGCLLMYTSMGSTKAAVLPDPVSATPITSRCCSPIGMAAIWMGEGLMYFCSRLDFSTMTRPEQVGQSAACAGGLGREQR